MEGMSGRDLLHIHDLLRAILASCNLWVGGPNTLLPRGRPLSPAAAEMLIRPPDHWPGERPVYMWLWSSTQYWLRLTNRVA